MTRKKVVTRTEVGATVFIVPLLLQWIPAVAGMTMSGGFVWVAKNYPCGAMYPHLRGDDEGKVGITNNFLHYLQ